MIKPGDQVGPYAIGRLLGRGGMGAVHLARHATLGRDVALKLIRQDLLTQPEHAERFRREMTALARFSHPHVVKVYESGEHEGMPWFAMELVPGGTLADLMLGEKPLPLARAREIAEALLSALAYLHDQGFLHRDIKPQNVQVPATGDVKLMDFGLVKDVAGTLMTEEGTALGTPRYMAPEVILGHGAGIASDLYQVGILTYQMLTGRLPIDAARLPELLEQLTRGKYTPLSELRPDLPASLERVVHGLLHVKPEARPQPASLVAKQLAAAFDESLLVTGPGIPVPTPVTAPGSATAGSAPPSKGSGKRGTSKVREASKTPPAPVSSAGASRMSLATLGAPRATAAVIVGVCIGLAMVAAVYRPRPKPPLPAASASPTQARSPGASASSGASPAGSPRPAPALASDLPPDHFPPTAVPGGFTFAAETLPGRRVTVPRGLASDARGRLFAGSAEGISWRDEHRWMSRALVPEPAGMAVLCADQREGVWLRVRLHAPHAGTDSWLVRADERGVLERIPVPDSFGRPAMACLLDNGDLLVATGAMPFLRDAATRSIAVLPTEGIAGTILGFFSAGARVGAWTSAGVYQRDGGAWHAVELPGGAPGAIRGASIAAGRLWVCGTQGAVAIALDGKSPALRVLGDRTLTGAFETAPDEVLLLGPSGIFRQPLAPLAGDRPPAWTRLAVPGVAQAGISTMGSAGPGEVWALTTTPLAFVRVNAAGVAVDSLATGDATEARAEHHAAPALWSMPGMCIPYAWLDQGATLAAGQRGKLTRIPVDRTQRATTLTELTDAVWPLDLWLQAPGRALYMIWQREGTSNRYIDRIDSTTGERRRAEGLPELMDGPVRVSPGGETIYQGPFIPIVQLLESGIYVRFHGERPKLEDMHGVRAPELNLWHPASRATGHLALPPDYAGGPLTFDPATAVAVYVSRDGHVFRRTLRATGPGPATRIAFPAGADERAVEELEVSPDGTLLAYVLQPRATGRSTLHLLDLETHASRRVGSYLYDYAQPRWSPDGRRLAFVRRCVDQTDAELAARIVRVDAASNAR